MEEFAQQFVTVIVGVATALGGLKGWERFNRRRNGPNNSLSDRDKAMIREIVRCESQEFSKEICEEIRDEGSETRAVLATMERTIMDKIK